MPLGAIRFLTILPLGPHPEPEEIGRNAWLGLPTVGLISGLIAGVVGWGGGGGGGGGEGGGGGGPVLQKTPRPRVP